MAYLFYVLVCLVAFLFTATIVGSWVAYIIIRLLNWAKSRLAKNSRV